MHTPTPFNDPAIRDWFFRDFVMSDDLPSMVMTVGAGPFEAAEFDKFLRSLGFVVSDILDGGRFFDFLIIGRDGWSEERLQSLLMARTDYTLRVYSQEMFLLFLASGIDLLDEPDELLTRFAENHPALLHLSSIGFRWPTTIVHGGGEAKLEEEWPEVGFLRHLGYRVGKQGVATSERRRLLNKAYTIDAYNEIPKSYADDWGEPRSGKRLSKMANSIAAFCKLQKRKDRPSWKAIDDWESDLEWLYRNYYAGRYNFQWPSTEVS